MDLKTAPYWWEAGEAPPPFAETPPRRVDLAVVGGGFTGMSAALTAAEAGASVCVIDAADLCVVANVRNVRGSFSGQPATWNCTF